MFALDTSVLAFAVNRYAPEHPRAARLLEELVNGSTPWALPTPVLHEFVSRVTHPHAVARPLRPAEAAAYLEQVLESPSVRVLAATSEHAAVLLDLLGSIDAPGGVLPGFEIAVLLREHGVRELLSADRGMRAFSFLTVRDPLHGEPWSPTERPTRRYRRLMGRITGTGSGSA